MVSLISALFDLAAFNWPEQLLLYQVSVWECVYIISDRVYIMYCIQLPELYVRMISITSTCYLHVGSSDHSEPKQVAINTQLISNTTVSFPLSLLKEEKRFSSCSSTTPANVAPVVTSPSWDAPLNVLTNLSGEFSACPTNVYCIPLHLCSYPAIIHCLCMSVLIPL